jgi:hypothetical protein
MKNLTKLNIVIVWPLKANQELCDMLCGWLKMVPLKYLSLFGGADRNGLYLPLIHAANVSQTLTHLRMQSLHSQTDVETYQTEVLKILDGNTRLVVALVCENHLTPRRYFVQEDLDMKAHINKECFLDGNKGNPKQRHIDYLTMLNLVGRSKAKEESTLLKDFIKLVSYKSLQRHIGFLEFESQAEQELIAILQYGLLREQPSLWLPKTWHLGCHRKRKAIGPPEECQET